MLNGLRPIGSLLECFLSFPQFRDDLEILVEEGFLQVTSSETCVWLKSKTSLAEYFKWAGEDTEWVPGGFWAPIEKTFGIKRHSLRRLASHNANILKPPQSRGFIKIKALLKKHHLQIQRQEKELLTFQTIKNLILEAKDEEPETINNILNNIRPFFNENVDKNRQNGRS